MKHFLFTVTGTIKREDEDRASEDLQKAVENLEETLNVDVSITEVDLEDEEDEDEDDEEE